MACLVLGSRDDSWSLKGSDVGYLLGALCVVRGKVTVKSHECVQESVLPIGTVGAHADRSDWFANVRQ